MVNLSKETQTIEPLNGIAQMVIAKYEQIEWEPVIELTSLREEPSGFGSTGTK
ncbi:MAG: hypothetical protein R2784_01700 [Saprospiraceae bacterium]